MVGLGLTLIYNICNMVVPIKYMLSYQLELVWRIRNIKNLPLLKISCFKVKIISAYFSMLVTQAIYFFLYSYYTGLIWPTDKIVYDSVLTKSLSHDCQSKHSSDWTSGHIVNCISLLHPKICLQIFTNKLQIFYSQNKPAIDLLAIKQFL